MLQPQPGLLLYYFGKHEGYNKAYLQDAANRGLTVLFPGDLLDERFARGCSSRVQDDSRELRVCVQSRTLDLQKKWENRCGVTLSPVCFLCRNGGTSMSSAACSSPSSENFQNLCLQMVRSWKCFFLSSCFNTLFWSFAWYKSNLFIQTGILVIKTIGHIKKKYREKIVTRWHIGHCNTLHGVWTVMSLTVGPVQESQAVYSWALVST